MKNRLIIFCLLLASSVFAQEQNNFETLLIKKSEIVFSNNAIFPRVRGKNFSRSAPVVMYKYKLNDKNHFLRLALIASNYSWQDEVPFEIQNTATSMKFKSKIHKNYNLNFSLAYEWQKYARGNKRLRYSYGLGAMFNSHEEDFSIYNNEYELNNGTYTLKAPNFETYTFVDNSAKKTKSIGGIAYVGIDYLIMKRLMLGFQANYMLGFSLNSNETYGDVAFLPTLSFKF